MTFKINRMHPITHKKQKYSEEEIDYLFLYCIETSWCGLISIEDAVGDELKLHYTYPQNNNFNNYKMYDDYSFDNRVTEITLGKKVSLKNRDAELKELREKQEVQHVDCIEGRTTREKLKSEIRKYPFTKVAKMYGVTDNAIRKWCRKMLLPDKSTYIKRYTDEEWALV